MKYLGLDIGEKRIGVAISESGVIARELSTIYVVSKEQAIREIVDIITKNQIGKVVIGFPKHMDGTHNHSTSEVQEFADKLRRQVEIPIIFEDERLTSVEAERLLKEQGIYNHELKEKVDQFSAKLILEQYFEKI